MNIPEIKSYEEQAIDTVVSVINRAKEKLGVRQTLKQLASEYHRVLRARQQFLNRRLRCYPDEKRPTAGDGCSQTMEFTSPKSWDIKPSFASFGWMTVPNNVPTAEPKGMVLTRDFACNVKLSMKPIGPPFAITSEKFINYAIEKKWKLGETFMYIVRYMGGSKDEVSQYYYFEAIFSQPTVAYPIPQAQVSVFFRLEDKHIEPPDERGVPLMYFRVEGHYTEHDMRYVALSADWILAMIKMKIKLFQRIEAIRIF